MLSVSYLHIKRKLTFCLSLCGRIYNVKATDIRVNQEYRRKEEAGMRTLKVRAHT
jgi:hypothetical protein